MKTNKLSLLLAMIVLCSLSMETARANHAAPAPKNQIAPEAGLTFSRQSVKIFDRITLNNSTLINNRPGGKTMVMPRLTVYFSNQPPVEYFLDNDGSGVPNGGSEVFTIPDMTNITWIEFHTFGDPLINTEWGTMTTAGGTVQFNGEVDMNGYIMTFYNVGTITGGITLTIY
ncbi:hypothetical protein [Longitalea arenae]|uniref:hypothetical protein n=1 Tax=Longitalea arenae TaxID=2812558 RepID=UPI001966E422|nr:hypothetical protein [Longitalea arenae]